jgi:hypothetical protein
MKLVVSDQAAFAQAFQVEPIHFRFVEEEGRYTIAYRGFEHIWHLPGTTVVLEPLAVGCVPLLVDFQRSLPSRRVDLKLRSPYHDLDVLFSVNSALVSDSAFEDPLRATISG